MEKQELEELLYFQQGGYQRPKKNVHRDNSTGVMGALGGSHDENQQNSYGGAGRKTVRHQQDSGIF